MSHDFILPIIGFDVALVSQPHIVTASSKGVITLK